MYYKLINIFLILLSLIFLPIVDTSCQIILHAHQSCHNSIRALNIINKLEQRLLEKGIKFTKIIEKKHNNYLLPLLQRNQSSLIYPTIQIRKQQKKITYQNQFSLVQLQYWITIHCINRIPSCASWMAQPIFPIRVYEPNQSEKDFNKLLKFLQFIYQYSPIKICIDSTLPIDKSRQKQQIQQAYNGIQSKVRQLMHQLPVFFKFNHNIRSYLLQNPQKTAIIFIYNNKILFHTQMKDKFLQMIHFIRRKDNRISYHLTQKAKQSLIFIIDKYNSQMVVRLLNFVNNDVNQVQINPFIVGFGFRNHQNGKKLQVIQYKIDQNTVLDNKFVYWLQQVALSVTNKAIKNKIFKTQNKICKQNQITHYYQENSVRQIVENIKILKILSKIVSHKNQQLEMYEKQIFTRVLNLYNQTSQIMNQTLFQIHKIISQEQLDLYDKFQLVQNFQFMISEPVLYSEIHCLKLCLVTHQPIRFLNFQQLFMFLKQNKLVISEQIFQSNKKKQKIFGRDQQLMERKDNFDQQL